MKLLVSLAVLLCLVLPLCACDILDDAGGEVSSADVESVYDNTSSEPVADSFMPDDDRTDDTSYDYPDMSEDNEGVTLFSGDFSYILENGVARICDYSGSDEELVVPDTLDGHTVTAIGEKAFYGNSTAKEIFIGDNVANIAAGAFGNCEALGAVYIGNSVAIIEPDCFDGCTSLELIDVSAANSSFASVEGVLFSKDRSRLIRCPEGYESEEYIVAEGTLSVGEGAFKGCDGVLSVIIPDGCVLSPCSFYLCTNLTAVSFGVGIVTVPDRCFFGCSLLEEIVIPDGVIVIGDYAFFGCVGATKLTLPDSISSISDKAFECCTGLEEINVSGEYAESWYENNKDVLLKS